MGKILLVSQNCSDLAQPNIEMKRFPDGENYVRIPDVSRCKGADVTIVQRCYPNQDIGLLQLLLLLRTVSEQKPSSITAVVPYLPYARQDKLWKEGESFSSRYVCDLLSESGATKLITFDCHFLKKAGTHKYGKLTIQNISMADSLIKYARKKLGDSPLFVSPDKGAAYLVEGNGGKSMSKVRGEYVESSDTAYREIKSLGADFDMSGKDVVIIDDMVAGGGTMIKAVATAKEGKAKSVSCCATHGLFLGGAIEKLRSAGAKEIFCTDSILTEVSNVKIADELVRSGVL